MVKSGISFVKIDSRFQIDLLFLFYRNFQPTRLFQPLRLLGPRVYSEPKSQQH